METLKRLIIIFSILLVASLSFNLISSADSVGNSDVITEDDAINASKEYLNDSDDFNVTGNLSVIGEVKLEREKNVLVYNIELEDEDGKIFDVLVDAVTGNIITQVDSKLDMSVKGSKEAGPEVNNGEDNGNNGKKPTTNMKFQVDGNNYTGKYVNFSYDSSTGEITNFTLGGTPVFSSILIEDFNDLDMKLKGSEIRFEAKSQPMGKDGVERITL